MQAVFISRTGAYLNGEKVAKSYFKLNPQQAAKLTSVVPFVKRGEMKGFAAFVGKDFVTERHLESVI